MTSLKGKRSKGNGQLEQDTDIYVISVFVHRARDVEHVIRSECIKELCTWSLHYSSHFVDNSYLRYIGWALNDQVHWEIHDIWHIHNDNVYIACKSTL